MQFLLFKFFPYRPGRPPSGRRPSSARSDTSEHRVHGERPMSGLSDRPPSSHRRDSRPQSGRSERAREVSILRGKLSFFVMYSL